ncbi:MAG: hypothetical protein ACJ0K4_04070 [Verrucomicrobiales bacterium]
MKKVQYAPDLFTKDAVRFIKENKEKPFFLYFAMNVPHAPTMRQATKAWRSLTCR